jgi:opacity protein-like surface antigen
MNARNTSLLSLGSGCIAALLGLAVNACSQEQDARKFYFGVDAGPAFATQTELKKVGDPVSDAKLDFDIGGRITVRGGYSFNSWVGVEFETGAIYNNLANLDGSLTQFPLLANVVLRYDRPDCRWIPYAGAGAGVDFSALTLDNVDAPNGDIVDGTGFATTGCYQAFAGVRYRLSDRTSLGLGYKFYSTIGDTSWDMGDFFSSDTVEVGAIRVHSVMLTFNLEF